MTLELRGAGKVIDGEVFIHPTDPTLRPGTMNVLLGPTSAGKTTLMRLMAELNADIMEQVRQYGRYG